MIKKSVAILCSVGLLASGSMPAPGFAETRFPPPDLGTGYCRTPPPLPNLGEEATQQQQSRRDRAGVMRGAPPPAPPPPPPPAPAPAITAEGGDAAISVTGSLIGGTSSEAAAPVASIDGAGDGEVAVESVARRRPPPPGIIMPPRPPRPQPRPQSGLLTAGEHDDLLNPELYADYVRKSGLGQSHMQLPRLDTSRLLTVEVRDNRGRAVPFEEVELRCADGNAIKLNTLADGKVVFFPQLDRLSDQVWVRAAGQDWRSIRLSRQPGAQMVKVTARNSAPNVRKLDLALVVDATGSMSDEMRYLAAELESIIGAIEERHPQLDIRIGFTFYRDEGDDYVTRTFGFDSDVGRARSRIAQQRANGGGDYPEAMDQALIRAAGLEWRNDAVKSLLLVADAPPHDDKIGRTWLAAEHLRAERVQIIPVGASGVADLAEYVMRAMAASTQSRYTFLTDDSGIGNKHAKPAIDCYLVTRLDQLLRRVIDSQISGRRIEPEDSEIIRSVGKYDAGKCILPANFGQEPKRQ